MLVSPKGQIDQGFAGPMKPTSYLDQLKYVQQVMAEIGCVWGRSRFMGLAAGAQVSPHVDTHYHWRTHWRLHIPVITNEKVRFICGDETVHMKAGECWLFDSFQPHEVHNEGNEKRVHLVLDTVGGGQLNRLLSSAQSSTACKSKFIEPDIDADHTLRTENNNIRPVMSPWEMRIHIDFLLSQCEPSPALQEVDGELDRLVDQWFANWAEWGEDKNGHPHYLDLIFKCRDKVFALGAANIRMKNGLPLFHCLREIVFRMAVERPEQETFPQRNRPSIGQHS
jgi:hypothetical protein